MLLKQHGGDTGYTFYLKGYTTYNIMHLKTGFMNHLERGHTFYIT